MKAKFPQYYAGVLFRPGKTFSDLLSEKRKLRFSLYAVSITAIVYTFVYVFLVFGGGLPFKPWLNIEPELYYRYNVFFCAPSMFLGWTLAAACVHLICRLKSNRGSFEELYCLFGFGLSIASWATGLHDLISSFLGAVHIIDQREYEAALNAPTVWRTLLWIQMTAYLVLFIIYFSVAVQTVYGLERRLSIIPGILGFLVYQFFFLIFNR